MQQKVAGNSRVTNQQGLRRSFSFRKAAAKIGIPCDDLKVIAAEEDLWPEYTGQGFYRDRVSKEEIRINQTFPLNSPKNMNMTRLLDFLKKISESNPEMVLSGASEQATQRGQWYWFGKS